MDKTDTRAACNMMLLSINYSKQKETQTCHQHFSYVCMSTTVQLAIMLTHLYSAPQPFTKLIRMVHIRVSWYTASKPRFTVCASSDANSWLLNIFRLHPK